MTPADRKELERVLVPCGKTEGYLHVKVNANLRALKAEGIIDYVYNWAGCGIRITDKGWKELGQG